MGDADNVNNSGTPSGDSASNSANSANANPSGSLPNLEPHNVYGYSAKLPTFWPNAPEAYFVQAESNFETARITVSRTKYNHLVNALPQHVVIENLRVLRESSASNDPYENLKAALIMNYTQSETNRLEDLLSQAEMGDKTPRQFYNTLSNIAGNDFMDKEELLRRLWMRRLPVEMQLPLKPFEDDTLATLLKVADGLYEVYKRQRQVSAVSSTEPTTKELKAQVAALTAQLAQMNSGKQFGGRSRSRSRNHVGNRDTHSDNSDTGLCWYHEQHGRNAKKCRQPCKWRNSSDNAKN